MHPEGSALLTAAGGLGFFLLGLSLMTEGLRSLAGSRLRQGLLHFTRTPWSGALSGAVTTALLQSSTATTVATVGFVSAGLLSFQASLGIIFGANVGSTGLGWLVALLGIKLNVGSLMLPLLLVGASLRLLGRGRQAQLGLALAGFALLFAGIHALQQAMAGQGLLLDPGRFDGSTVLGRLQLLLLGLLTTVITHSSGAGVATTLAALAAGALSLPQALALVIGMDLGSTLTALVAALGANLSARRTAVAHLVFNLFTAGLAFALLPAYWQGLQRWLPALAAADPEFAVTAFHTGFNLAGVLLLLPFTAPYARLIRQLVRGNGDRRIDALDDVPPPDSALALEQAEAALLETYGSLLSHLQRGLGLASCGPVVALPVLQTDLDRLELFLDQIHLGQPTGGLSSTLLHLLHGLDHLQRLHERCEEEPERQRTVATCPALGAERQALHHTLEKLAPLCLERQWQQAQPLVEALADHFEQRGSPFRRDVLAAVARGELVVEAGTGQLEAMRWLQRVSRHLERLNHHLGRIPNPLKGHLRREGRLNQ
ncbi:MAG: Na/Pi symporter [Cyanobacteriota bacterium]|nr:Na/Pi symporter [Cyanobacteriota bacterium]